MKRPSRGASESATTIPVEWTFLRAATGHRILRLIHVLGSALNRVFGLSSGRESPASYFFGGPGGGLYPGRQAASMFPPERTPIAGGCPPAHRHDPSMPPGSLLFLPILETCFIIFAIIWCCLMSLLTSCTEVPEPSATSTLRDACRIFG